MDFFWGGGEESPIHSEILIPSETFISKCFQI